MKQEQLRELNFNQLIDYGGAPTVQRDYPEPIPCSGFCLDCEKQGILETTGGRLTRMSHGCDSEDYETILGPLQFSGQCIDAPVMFLFQDPSPSKDQGTSVSFDPVNFDSYTKYVPARYYYWSPRELTSWPASVGELPHLYGPFIAYLANRFALTNFYVTNFVKCLLEDSKNWSPIKNNCQERYLKREIEIFRPELVICFGDYTGAILSEFLESHEDIQEIADLNYVVVPHPANRQSKSGRIERTKKIISDKLLELGWISHPYEPRSAVVKEDMIRKYGLRNYPWCMSAPLSGLPLVDEEGSPLCGSNNHPF